MFLRAGPVPQVPNAPRVQHADPVEVRTGTHVFHGRFVNAKDLSRAGTQRADVSAHYKSNTGE